MEVEDPIEDDNKTEPKLEEWGWQIFPWFQKNNTQNSPRLLVNAPKLEVWVDDYSDDVDPFRQASGQKYWMVLAWKLIWDIWIVQW